MTAAPTGIPPLGTILPIWPGTPPGSSDWHWSAQESVINGEMLTRNVTVPTLEVFPPVASANGTAVIVAPGGAFHVLAVEFEGTELAAWLADRGVAAFVLRYRLARTPADEPELLAFLADLDRRVREVPWEVGTRAVLGEQAERAKALAEEDGRQAVRLLRTRAHEWGVDPARIGMVGFSAGAGVTIEAAASPDPDSRPDFAAPLYGSRPAAAAVPSDAPPLFLAAARDDPAVPPAESVATWTAWQEAGRPAELHIFATGGHGFGVKTQGLGSDAWLELFQTWMVGLGLLGEPGPGNE